MHKVTWKEGEGLENGLPDSGWPIRKLITIYPINFKEDAVGVVTGWRVMICWGDTWGHLVSIEHEDYTKCMSQACRRAVLQGCPKEWLPVISEE